ncbi:hypothetical protein BDB01DRAFT_852128 [Pilobolus umbonatus]|nr:hypothetical protein BDB01DRAFT_852128 [Pilobolus umbonatus]
MATPITAIDKESVHRICSGQVVLDLCAAVKELVENSIDAGATSIEIKFKEKGINGLEVIDNGSGIDPENYGTLALKHYTSKLVSFSDLEKVATLGFRGEALSSLCSLSNVTVITATKHQAPIGNRLTFDSDGHLQSTTQIARSKGTTVQLSNLFHSLPVRSRDFKRNITREYTKTLGILQAYCIICTNIRISITNQSAKKQNEKVMATSGNSNVSGNIANIFGASTVSQISPFTVHLESVLGEGMIRGFLSKAEWNLGRRASDRQYFYINGRPCSLPKMAREINDIYRSFITDRYPMVVADFILPTDSYDVNLTPDKRTIFVHNEDKIIDAISDQLRSILEPSRSTFKIHPTIPSAPVINDKISLSNSDISIDPMDYDSDSLDDRPSSPSYKPRVSNSLSIGMGNSHRSTSTTTILKRMPDSLHTIDQYVNKKNRTTETGVKVSRNDTITTKPKRQNLTTDTEISILESSKQDRSIINTNITTGHWNTLGRSMKMDSPNITYFADKYKNCGMADIIKEDPKPAILDDAHISHSDTVAAEEALRRVINKTDFFRMKVLGQFNLGFIIVSLDDKDLYIIDQHASDEKYNFEMLQKTTTFEGQRLFKPLVLDLTAAEEHIVMDNVHIFRANGFEIEVLPDNQPTKRIQVISQPISKNTMFDKKDFSEIIHLISERPGEMIRCSRIRAMFASRACHKATRIGDSLNKKQMEEIIRHMGEIDQPWNCPHGRPTMRHLLNPNDVKKAKRGLNWKLTYKGSLFSNK